VVGVSFGVSSGVNPCGRGIFYFRGFSDLMYSVSNLVVVVVAVALP
jgi:hypothetical protein